MKQYQCKTCNRMIDDYDKEESYYVRNVAKPAHTECVNRGECPDCAEKTISDQKIGSLSPEIKKLIESKGKVDFKYGQEISVLVTKHGIFFEDIC